MGALFSCSCLKTKAAFSLYQALADSLCLQFGTLVLHKESVSSCIHSVEEEYPCVRGGLTGHGLHGTCSIPGYKVWVGGRASTVDECVS